jgi:hypothetical protein
MVDEIRERFHVSSANFPPSLMVSAVIEPTPCRGKCQYRRLNLKKGKLGFINELNAKYGENSWIFQQDGAPCETSAAAYARDLIAITTINSLCPWFQARLEFCRDQEGDSISRALRRLGEIDAMREFTNSASIVQVTWMEEEKIDVNRLVRQFDTQRKKSSIFFESKKSNQLKNRWSVTKSQLFKLHD